MVGKSGKLVSELTELPNVTAEVVGLACSNFRCDKRIPAIREGLNNLGVWLDSENTVQSTD